MCKVIVTDSDCGIIQYYHHFSWPKIEMWPSCAEFFGPHCVKCKQWGWCLLWQYVSVLSNGKRTMPQSWSACKVMIFATNLILISDWLIRSLPCDWSNTGRLLRFCMLLIPLSEVFRQSWAAYTSIVFMNWFGISMISIIINAYSSWDSSFTGLGFGWASGWCLRRIWILAVNIWPVIINCTLVSG